jgi:hypothetical protein
MTKTTRTTGLMLATGLATLALLQTANALEADAFIERFETVFGAMGYELDFGAATLDGDTITVDGVTVNVVGTTEAPMAIDTELTFTGVTENEDGSYSAEQLSVPDIDTEFAQDPVGHVTLTGIVAEDLWLPPEGETGAADLLQTVGRIATGPLSVTRDGTEVIRYDGLDFTAEFTYDSADELESLTSDFAITNIWADLSTVSEEDPQAGAVIEALGLTNIDGNITQKFDWTLADGRMAMTEFLFDFADVGALDITMDISGFTPEVLDKIYAMQAAMADVDPTSEEAQAQQMMAGMEMAQALSIHSATIRYDDASLAGNLLEFFGAQSGTDRAGYVELLKAQLPAMIAGSGVPQLNDVVVPPVSAFLDDPQSLEISVEPATPTSFLVLAAAAANPAGLISALGLAVTANEAAE